MSNKYGNQRPRQKLTSIKCVTNPQHNTPDKNCIAMTMLT